MPLTFAPRGSRRLRCVVMMMKVVLKVHHPTLPVRQPAIIENLQHHVEDVRMRLLDLIEQNHRIRPPPNRLGQLPPSSEPTYPGGAPISRATLCFSWYSLRSMRIIACSSSNSDSASARANSVLPTPVGPRKMKLTNRPLRILQPAPRPQHRLSHRRHRLILTHHPFMQIVCPDAAASSSRLPAASTAAHPSSRLTTSAMSSSSTSSFDEALSLGFGDRRFRRAQLLLQRDQGSVLSSTPCSDPPPAAPARSRSLVCSICSRSPRTLAIASFSVFQRACMPVLSAFRSASSFSASPAAPSGGVLVFALS